LELLAPLEIVRVVFPQNSSASRPLSGLCQASMVWVPGSRSDQLAWLRESMFFWLMKLP
jgi:hypothetical protein